MIPWHVSGTGILVFFPTTCFITPELFIQGQPQPFNPFLHVPSQVCFLHETVCHTFVQPPVFPLWAAHSSSPDQRACYLSYLVLYCLLTLSCSPITFCMFILFPQINFFTTYQREASHQNFLSTCYVPGPLLGASYIVSFNPHNTPWDQVLLSPFYK